MRRNSTPNYHQQIDSVNHVSTEPLRPVAAIDGHQVYKFGHEFGFSNDALIYPLQPYPGAWLPDKNLRGRFPIPDEVGAYCTYEEFVKKPKYMAQWVHWPKRAELILKGHYHELIPVHFEGIFTLVCNFMCPHCTRRVTRREWIEEETWINNSTVNKKNTMHPENLKRILDQVSTMRIDEQMGIVWGGGDPTANPFTYDAMLYAKSLGINSSFLTNGVYLDVEKVLNADPILIRISLNCGTEQNYRKFHGYPRGWDYFERVKQNLRELVRRKLERTARTLIGISIIMDERNLDDVYAAIDVVKSIVKNVGPGIDYVIVRPVFNYTHFKHKWAHLNKNTKKKARELVEEGGSLSLALKEFNIPLIPIKDSFESPPPDTFYKDTKCLAYGLCGEIRHNGDVQLCSDSYGNPDYTIGNLLDQNIQEIWKSEKRINVLSKINANECFKTICPHNSRGHHYNRIFHQIEEMRKEDKMDIVLKWVEDLRESTLPLGHSFFI